MHNYSYQMVVLVVDDELFARLFAVQIFLDEGLVVLEASDAEEAIRLLEDNDDISVLFTDISMPGSQDGLDLVRYARSLRPEVGIVVTSGLGEPSADQLPAGGRFLPKPYSAHTLMKVTRELIAPGASLADSRHDTLASARAG